MPTVAPSCRAIQAVSFRRGPRRRKSGTLQADKGCAPAVRFLNRLPRCGSMRLLIKVGRSGEHQQLAWSSPVIVSAGAAGSTPGECRRGPVKFRCKRMIPLT